MNVIPSIDPMSWIVDFIPFLWGGGGGGGGGWRWREGHAPSHLGSKRVLVTFYFP